MNCMEDLLKEIVNEMKKDIPADVVAELEELSRLEAEVHSSMLHSRIVDTGKVKRINELIRKHYYHGEQDRPEETAQPVKTFDFGEAIRRVKGGARVARKGWNGKGQNIQLACNISYMTKGGDIVNPTHANIENSAIAFFGTSGTQIGWLASQADMLADDWYEVESGWLKDPDALRCLRRANENGGFRVKPITGRTTTEKKKACENCGQRMGGMCKQYIVGGKGR